MELFIPYYWNFLFHITGIFPINNYLVRITGDSYKAVLEAKNGFSPVASDGLNYHHIKSQMNEVPRQRAKRFSI
jgi:hypothetical protein